LGRGQQANDRQDQGDGPQHVSPHGEILLFEAPFQWELRFTHLSMSMQLLCRHPPVQVRPDTRQGDARGQPVTWAGERATGVDPQTSFDSHIKRIHGYERHLLNALHIVVLYNRLRPNPILAMPPLTFFVADKAAPAYWLPKVFLKRIKNIAAMIEAESAETAAGSPFQRLPGREGPFRERRLKERSKGGAPSKKAAASQNVRQYCS
jgi:hypothetical protein